MAQITFYDSTELDKEQLSNSLSETDHHWEFISDKISLENSNAEAEVISVFVTSEVTREMIEKMPKLRLIACRSTGFNNIDLDATKENDVTVVNVPTYGNETVAEFAFTMLLALTRKLPAILDAEHEQFSPEDLTGSDLHGKVFGVIGTGHIGQKSLKIANGFSMKTIAYDAFPNEELEGEIGFNYVELDEVLTQSDVVSLHVPLLPSTHHIMNHENLGKMKKGAILINTARGELVDSKALVEFLANDHLGGAAIDVVEGESLLNHSEELNILLGRTNSRGTMQHSVEISVLKEMPNVIISPHNAYNTTEAIARINGTTAQNIIDFWYDKTPNKVVSPKKPTGKLLVVRHGESEWNATGRWTGITDVHLSSKGFKEAALLGKAVQELEVDIDLAFCSEQIRTRETLEGILNTAQEFDVDITPNSALNERDYGEYTGRNKQEMKETLGEEKYNALLRGWDEDVPGGETLKMVYERVIPFYKEQVVPLVLKGKNVIIVAHSNSIRAMMKYIESISDDDVSSLQIKRGQILMYDISDEGLRLDSSIVDIEAPASPNT